MPSFCKESLAQLATVDEHLQVLFKEVVKRFDCKVLEGRRSAERQRELVAAGKSKTLQSKHLTGLAVDVAPYPIDWDEHWRFYLFAGYVLRVAEDMGIGVRWGGDWDGNLDPRDNGTFNDLPHWELRQR